MTVAGKRGNFISTNLLDAASAADMKPTGAKAVCHQVHTAVTIWQAHAESVNISAECRGKIWRNLRLEFQPR